jgi:hypothetical protein
VEDPTAAGARVKDDTENPVVSDPIAGIVDDESENARAEQDAESLFVTETA